MVAPVTVRSQKAQRKTTHARHCTHGQGVSGRFWVGFGLRVETNTVVERNRRCMVLDAGLLQRLVDELRHLSDDTRAEMVTPGSGELAVWCGHVVAHEIGARSPVQLLVHPTQVRFHCVSQRRGELARRVGIAQELPQEQLSRDHGATGSLSCHASATQALVGAGWAVEGLGQRDTARPVWGARPLVENERLAADGTSTSDTAHPRQCATPRARLAGVAAPA
jgi:hypothetical protein